MTTVERASEGDWFAPEVPLPHGPVVMDTSEARWFAPGPVPSDVLSWFAGRSTITAVDERIDTYLLHGIRGLGVKYRSRRVLEVKRRMSAGAEIVLGHGLRAELVRWQKWQPTELDAAWSAPGLRRIDVHKVVLKSSLALIDGAVVPTDLRSEASTPSCNIELASVRVEGTASWTLGFEASGPVAMRRQVLLESWQAVVNGSLPDMGFERRFEVAAAYPEWLERHLPYELAG